MRYQTLLDFRKIEKVAQKISSILPDDPKILKQEFKNSTKPFLSAILKKADLVSRQEFEAQRNLLQQAERKLAELEARLKNFKE
jgi:BMFP domain-containing protein YqiC